MREGWERRRIAEIIEPMTTIDPRRESNKSFTYIDVSSVSRDTCEIVEPNLIKGVDAPSRARRLVRAGDVIFATIRPSLQRIAEIPKALDGAVCSTGYFVLRPKPIVLTRFLFYSLFTQEFSEAIAALQRGAAYPAVSDGDVRARELSIPPLSEQKLIVAILDEAFAGIATAVANTDKNLVNAHELFESYLNSVFIRLSESSCHMRFGDIAEFVRGPFGGSLKKGCFSPVGYAVYEQQHAINDQFSAIRYFVDENKFQEMARFELRPNDLIMSCSGTMGRVAIAPANLKRGIINQALLKLTPSTVVDACYLRFWMESRSFLDEIISYSKGAAIKNVASVKVLKEIQIPLPDLGEQQALVKDLTECLEGTSELANLCRQKLASLAELKQSLLQKAFSGELTAGKEVSDAIREAEEVA